MAADNSDHESALKAQVAQSAAERDAGQARIARLQGELDKANATSAAQKTQIASTDDTLIKGLKENVARLTQRNSELQRQNEQS